MEQPALSVKIWSGHTSDCLAVSPELRAGGSWVDGPDPSNLCLRDCPSFPGHSIMNSMSFSETIFLFFLALVIFGPKKLPEIARQVGKYLNEFRRASNEFKAQIEQEIAHLEVEEKRQTILPPEPVEGTTSRTLQAGPVGES